jgi:hypothetical protein
MKVRRLGLVGFMICMAGLLCVSPSVLASFHDNGNGTVSDTSTGLMWQQDTARDEWGDYDHMTWEEALDYCEVLSLGGHTDWRLPNIKELDSLMDLSRYSPAINTVYFPNTLPDGYWSSTTCAQRPGYTWTLYFSEGLEDWRNKSGSYCVRAVRDGQGESFPVPDIKANGSDGPVEIALSEALSVTIELDPGDYPGVQADWWCVADTPFGWYYYDDTGTWLPGLYVSYQGPLFILTPPLEVLSMYGLPIGGYTFYFGVDGNRNGNLDEPLYYDSVEVSITP